MIKGLLQLLVFQGFGELVHKFLIPPIPGPVIGLVSLVLWLIIVGKVNDELASVSGQFSQHLGILFIPAAVGVVLFLPQLKTHWLGLLLALGCSVALTITSTALVLKFLWGVQVRLRKVREPNEQS